MASDAPYLSFIDDPEAFPFPGGVSAPSETPFSPPLAVNQPVPPVAVPLSESVIKYRLSLVLPAFSPRHFHIWEIFVYSEPSALQHYIYLLERQSHIAHLVDRCVVETYHVACLTRTPRRVTVRPATPTA